MRAIVRLTIRPLLAPGVQVPRQRRLLDAVGRVARFPDGTRLSTVDLGGRRAERLEPPGADPARAVLYLHGGGFTVGSPVTHRALAAYVASAAGAPLFAELTGLPPMLIHVGEDEILGVDAERLYERARAAGVQITYRRLPHLWHVAHLHAGLVAESTAAAHEVGVFVGGNIRHPAPQRPTSAE